MAVTGHFVCAQGQLRAVLLKLIDVTDLRHDAVSLSEAIRTQVLEIHNNVNVVCAVTDGAANMLATTNLLKVKHLPCFAHKIQLVVNGALLSESGKKNVEVVNSNDVENIQK